MGSCSQEKEKQMVDLFAFSRAVISGKIEMGRFFLAPYLVLLAVLLLGSGADAQQVIGGSVTVVQGDTAVLPCKLRLTDTTEDLTQITWQKRTREKPSNDNFITVGPSQEPRFVSGRDDRFKYIGNFNDKNGTLQLSNVALKDEGSYTCIFTLFPGGTKKTEIPLKVTVPPFTNVKDNLPTLGTEEVLFATCTAAGSRPPAEVRWLTGDLEKKVRTTTNSIQYDNGTTTTVSSLFGVPTSEINGHQVQCVISGDFLTKEISLPFTIQVYFSPTEVNIRLISEDTFECVAAANPRAKYNWSRSDQPLLESAVKVDGAKLQLLSLTSGLNGLYRCEASNAHGSKHSQLYVHVAGTCSAAWTFFGLLVSVNAIGAAVWCFSKSGYFKKRHHLVSKDSKNGTNSQREILREKLTAVESRNG
ncbi:unnamed protein product [Oreochromis niloticus]|nr:unnamed protein product [Mustela putorius furo]